MKIPGNKKIKIGFDARGIFSPPSRGMSKVAVNLYKRMPLLEPEWDFYLYYIPSESVNKKANTIFTDIKNIRKKGIDIKGHRFMKEHIFSVWENVSLPATLLFDQISLLHCADHTSPYYISCPKLATIHDLCSLMANHQYMTQHGIDLLRFKIERLIKGSEKIIAVSEYTKKDILETFGMRYEKKIKVIYSAPSDNCRPLQMERGIVGVKNKYSIKGPYIFAFGDIYPRKNFPRLIKSFAILTKTVKKDIQLVISGQPEFAKLFNDLRSLANSLGVEEKVNFIGFVPDDDIPFLLSGAEFLSYISLYEGFGLPILDAMACDCPVIASNTTAIPEAAGDAAILVDPCDVDQIADAMANLLNDSRLRQELIVKGRERVKLFSWDKAATETIKVQKEALGA